MRAFHVVFCALLLAGCFRRIGLETDAAMDAPVVMDTVQSESAAEVVGSEMVLTDVASEAEAATDAMDVTMNAEASVDAMDAGCAPSATMWRFEGGRLITMPEFVETPASPPASVLESLCPTGMLLHSVEALDMGRYPMVPKFRARCRKLFENGTLGPVEVVGDAVGDQTAFFGENAVSSCAPEEVVTGLRVFYGGSSLFSVNVVWAVALQCSVRQSDGTLGMSRLLAQVPSAAAVMQRLDAADVRCPSGSVMVGLRAPRAQAAAQLGGTCQRLVAMPGCADASAIAPSCGEAGMCPSELGWSLRGSVCDWSERPVNQVQWVVPTTGPNQTAMMMIPTPPAMSRATVHVLVDFEQTAGCPTGGLGTAEEGSGTTFLRCGHTAPGRLAGEDFTRRQQLLECRSGQPLQIDIAPNPRLAPGSCTRTIRLLGAASALPAVALSVPIAACDAVR